ncbi:hypothetical protein B4U79_01205, partial [Dinothrombium tinctorium]
MINGGDRIKALNCLDVSVTIHKGGKMIGSINSLMQMKNEPT